MNDSRKWKQKGQEDWLFQEGLAAKLEGWALLPKHLCYQRNNHVFGLWNKWLVLPTRKKEIYPFLPQSASHSDEAKKQEQSTNFSCRVYSVSVTWSFLQISKRFNGFQHEAIMALEFSRWHRMIEGSIWVVNTFPWIFLLQGCRHVPQPHALRSGYCSEEDKVFWASISFLCLQCHKIQDGLQASPDQETKLTLVSLLYHKWITALTLQLLPSERRKFHWFLFYPLSYPVATSSGPQWIWSL